MSPHAPKQPPQHPPIERKRRSHAKSRKGCANCKLRRVKCDEGRPRCRKCTAYGVACDYSGSKPLLDLAAQGAFQVDLAPDEAIAAVDISPISSSDESVLALDPPPVSCHVMATSMINHSLFEGEGFAEGDGLVMAGLPHTFTVRHFEVMKRFQDRTVATIGTRQSSETYRNCITHMACSHPFLMHMVLTLTLLHDAHLTPSGPASTSIISLRRAALAHWSTATILFASLLSRPVHPSHRDAIWATGALLGTASMAYLESTSPHDAWPLKPSDPNDLAWLKLSEGKRAIWSIAQPWRADSIFHTLGKAMNHWTKPPWITNPDLGSLPPRLSRLFDIDENTCAEDNVYLTPLLCLRHTARLPLTRDHVMRFIVFLLYMSSEFRALLEAKDPRAMVLLLWWFRQVAAGDGEVWWMTQRARVEGQAIEIWLERWCGGEQAVVEEVEGEGVGEEEAMIMGRPILARMGEEDGEGWIV